MTAMIQGKDVNGLVVGNMTFATGDVWKTYVDNAPINKRFNSVTYTYQVHPEENYIKLYFAANIIDGESREKNKLMEWSEIDWSYSSKYALLDLSWLVKDITRVGVGISSDELGSYHWDSRSSMGLSLVNDKNILYISRQSGVSYTDHPQSSGPYLHSCGINGPEPRIYYTELADGIS